MWDWIPIFTVDKLQSGKPHNVYSACMKSSYSQPLRADETGIDSVGIGAPYLCLSAQQKTGSIRLTALVTSRIKPALAEYILRRKDLSQSNTLERTRHSESCHPFRALVAVFVPYMSKSKCSTDQEPRGILSALWNRPARW